MDGHYCSARGWRTSTFPTWVAINLEPRFTRLLLSWNSGATGDYQPAEAAPSYGIPLAYTLQTSADSTNGGDGTWTTVTNVDGNRARTREHVVPFAGATWIKMTVTGVIPGTVDHLLSIDEIDVHDASQGTDDTVFFMGDSITAEAYLRCDNTQPSYAELVHRSLPAFFPAMIDGGVGSVNSSYGVEMIDDWLRLNSDYRVWAIGYGTNDAWQQVSPEKFDRQLQAIVDAVKIAGKLPVLARIPFAARGPQDTDVQTLNKVVDLVAARNGLVSGPDFYTWFRDHPQELGSDGVHPTPAGSISMNRLWQEALRPLYGSAPAS